MRMRGLFGIATLFILLGWALPAYPAMSKEDLLKSNL